MKNDGYSSEEEPSAVEILRITYKAEDVIALIDRIKVAEKVKRKILGDLYEYRFYLDGKTLLVESDKMLKSNMFAQRHLEEFDELPSANLNKKAIWPLFIKALKEQGKIKRIDASENTEEVYQTKFFLTSLRDIRVTNDKKALKRNRNQFLEKDGYLYLPASAIKTLKDSQNMRVEHDRFVKLARRYLICDGKSVRVGDEGDSKDFVWCWQFSKALKDDVEIILSSFPTESHTEESNTGGDTDVSL